MDNGHSEVDDYQTIEKKYLLYIIHYTFSVVKSTKKRFRAIDRYGMAT